MAHSKQALKRWRQSIEARNRNRATKSVTRSTVRTLRESVGTADEATVAAALSEAYSALDRAARKGAIHTGRADRQKRRLAALVAKSRS